MKKLFIILTAVFMFSLFAAGCGTVNEGVKNVNEGIQNVNKSIQDVNQSIQDTTKQLSPDNEKNEVEGTGKDGRETSGESEED